MIYNIIIKRKGKVRKMLKTIVIVVILALPRMVIAIANERAKEKAENERRMKAVKDGIEIFQRTRKENNK